MKTITISSKSDGYRLLTAKITDILVTEGSFRVTAPMEVIDKITDKTGTPPKIKVCLAGPGPELLVATYPILQHLTYLVEKSETVRDISYTVTSPSDEYRLYEVSIGYSYSPDIRKIKVYVPSPMCDEEILHMAEKGLSEISSELSVRECRLLSNDLPKELRSASECNYSIYQFAGILRSIKIEEGVRVKPILKFSK